jgi:hypothetical protein
MTAAAVAELIARCRSAGLSLVPEDEALHVDFQRKPPAELIKELRRRKREVMAALIGATVIAPVQCFEPAAADDKPPYHEPCEARRGLIRERAGCFEHFCITCGAWGAFGFGVTADKPGRWFCLAHRRDGESGP